MKGRWIKLAYLLLPLALTACAAVIETPTPAETPAGEPPPVAVTETITGTITGTITETVAPTVTDELTLPLTTMTVTEPVTNGVAVTAPATSPPAVVTETAPLTDVVPVVTPTATLTAPVALPAEGVSEGLLFTDTANLTILEILQTTGEFSVLATAVEQAGMATALAGPGPYTLFAPTDQAFAVLPPVISDALLADLPLLTDLLGYHLIADQADAARLAELNAAQSLVGEPLTITITTTGERLVNDARIIRSDVQAANGVIHVVDRILTHPALALVLPAAPATGAPEETPGRLPLAELAQADTSGQTIVEILRSAEGLSVAAAAVDSAGLTAALEEPGPFTLFVPTDEAFNQLPAATLEALLNDTVALAGALQYHLVRDYVTSVDLARLPVLLTVNGQQLQVVVLEDGRISVNGSLVQQVDIEAVNGVIHVISTILTPPTQ
jgi:transforming growth factor-beta-induced protein